MTIGQRIAQKRKELGLSQEGLGEELGVSRQAIYKWESDATLPEIDKLIALSRRFGVSVGWLLGEEDASPAGGELSAEQLAMVQEIVDRYLAAQRESEAPPSWQVWPEGGDPDLSPEQRRLVHAVAQKVREEQPEPESPKKRRRWPWVLLGLAACITLIIVGAGFSNRLDQVTDQYTYLQNSIGNMQNGVSVQINAITNRVEEILKSQNDLTADYTTAVASTDPAGGMVTFSFKVRPRTYEEGMIAWIDVANGTGQPGEGQARITVGPFEANREVFAGEVTVGLTDLTSLYIIFEHNGVRQTQLLDTYTNLLRSSFPNAWADTWPLTHRIDSESNTLTEMLYAELNSYGVDNTHRAAIESYRVGLFADRELVAWFTPTVREYYLNGVLTQEEIQTLAPDGILLDRAKEYVIAAVIVDEYGREFVMQDSPARWMGDDWGYTGDYDNGPFFTGWKY